MPLHSLSSETGISQDELLDILSGRTNITITQLDAVCEALNSSEIALDGHPGWRKLAPSVQEQLAHLKTIDKELMDCIREFYSRGQKASELTSMQNFDSERWNSCLHELKTVYEGYHTDILSLLAEAA